MYPEIGLSWANIMILTSLDVLMFKVILSDGFYFTPSSIQNDDKMTIWSLFAKVWLLTLTQWRMETLVDASKRNLARAAGLW